jgi:predicted metal-dependent phosphoesterase TrpH
MKTVLEYYEVYPKIFPVGKKEGIQVRPLGDHAEFSEKIVYSAVMVPMNEINLNDKEHPYEQYELAPKDGILSLEYCFKTEGQYALIITFRDVNFWGQEVSHEIDLRLYAAEADLLKLRPYRGDMHCHTFRSDGIEAPAIVAANYRKAGFDFLAITDHGQYEPSLEAIAAYGDAPIDLRLFPGEEVHPPENNSHYVHFAGKHSVNSLFRANPDQYRKEVEEIRKTLALPAGVNAGEYASALWVIREIHKAEGLAVMAHPCWIQDHAYHIHESMYEAMLKNFPFDALELTCGQSREENQMQVSLWQEMRARGYGVNIVGSSDSHGTVNSTWFNLSKMVVLAESCDRDPLIAAVKAGRVVVLEQYAGEELPRLYGSHRYTAFVLFLLNEYFPLHDELCFEEGRQMKAHVTGDPDAASVLKVLQGRCNRLMKRCWA